MKRFKTEEDKRNEANKKTGIIVIIATVVIVSLAYNIIFPHTLIGMIWDYDIESQLKFQNEDGIRKNADEVRFRLTYENNDETDLRVERAINVYFKVFDYNPENEYKITKLENSTLLEFTWQTQYGD